MLYGVEAQYSSPAAAGGGYTAGAIHFEIGNGATYLTNNSLSAGTDNGFFSFSLWALGIQSGDNSNDVLWVIDPAGAYDPFLWINSGDLLTFEVLYTQYNIEWGTGLPPDTTWTHLLGSADTNFSAGNKISVLYANDVLLTPDVNQDFGASFISAVNNKKFVFGDDTFGNGPTLLDVADVWIAPNVRLHNVSNVIPEATRRQFINADLTPVDPATWPTSAIQFYGDASTFATNHGTGGAFTLTGSLTNAATHP
jgi:hypothetical protein